MSRWPGFIGFAVAIGACAEDRRPPSSSSPVVERVAVGRELGDWIAWSASPRGVATAPAFGQPAFVARLDGGGVSSEGYLLDSDTTMLADPAQGQYLDVDGRRYEGARGQDLQREPTDVYVQRTERGVVLEAVRDRDWRVHLTVWQSPGSPAWTTSVAWHATSVGAALSPDGAHVAFVASGRDHLLTLAVLDARTGTERWSLPLGLRLSIHSAVRAPIAFSADGQQNVVVTNRQAHIRTIDGAFVANVRDAGISVVGNVDRLRFAFGLRGRCLWSTMFTHDAPRPRRPYDDVPVGWDCYYSVFDVETGQVLADTGSWMGGEALHRAVFGEGFVDCPARLVTSSATGLRVVSYARHEIEVRTWRGIPGCE